MKVIIIIIMMIYKQMESSRKEYQIMSNRILS